MKKFFKLKNSKLLTIILIFLILFLCSCNFMNRYSIKSVKKESKDLESQNKEVYIKGKVDMIVDLTISEKENIIEKIKDLVKITASKLIEGLISLFNVETKKVEKVFLLKEGKESILCITSIKNINENDNIVLKGKVRTILSIKSPESIRQLFSKWNSIFVDKDGNINLILFEGQEVVSKNIFGRFYFLIIKNLLLILIIIGIVIFLIFAFIWLRKNNYI